MELLKINRLTISGRLIADPKATLVGENKLSCEFNLLVSEVGKKDAKGRNKANIVRVISWGNRAKACCENLEKGQWVTVEGKLQIRSYTDATQKKCWVAECVAGLIEFGQKPAKNNKGSEENGSQE